MGENESRLPLHIWQSLDPIDVGQEIVLANVQVAPDGTVKVLDFGLAAYEAAGEPSSDLSQSPTMMVATGKRRVQVLEDRK